MRGFVGLSATLVVAMGLMACSKSEKQTEIAKGNDLPLISADGKAQKVIQIAEGKYEAIYVMGESDTNWCEIAMPNASYHPGVELRSRKRSGDDIDVDCHWDDGYFVRSSKHNTWSTFTIDGSTVSADFHLVNPKTGQYLAFVAAGMSTEKSKASIR